MDRCITIRCYMCIQWTRVLYSAVITCQSNPPLLQFNSPYIECTSVWSMFVYITNVIFVYTEQQVRNVGDCVLISLEEQPYLVFADSC